jgi:hypothetical protein
MTSNDENVLKQLLDTVRNIAKDPKNAEKSEFWELHSDYTTDKRRGTPRPRIDLPKAPSTVEPEMPMRGLMLVFKADKYYSDPFT